MATITENKRIENVTAETEARIRHNAMIQERYRRLQNIEAEQFMETTQNEATSAYTVRASVLAPERPAYTAPSVNAPMFEQTPQVTEYVRTRSESPVFTTEKFNAFQETAFTAVAPVAQQTVVEMPVQAVMQAPVQAVAQEVEEQYSLSRFAKAAMATFATVIAAMFTLIGVNTRIIENKTAQLNALEAQQTALMQEYAELQSQIEIAESEETIRQYVAEKGLN